MHFDRRTMLAGLGAATLPLPTLAASTRGDPERLRAWLAALHPGLYRYQTPRQFAARFTAFERAWAARPSLEARFLTLSRLLSAIRCGHTFCNLNNQSDAIAARLTEGKRLLPLRFRWIGDAMVVVGDPHGTGIAPGTRIAAIDGTPSAAIFAALMPLTRADGHNPGKQRALLSVEGNDRFETFDVFHPLVFPGSGDFRLRLVGRDGGRSERRLAPIDRAERLRTLPPGQDRASTDPWWSAARRGDATVLTMKSWAVYDAKWAWKPWLDQRLKAIADDGTRGLIIDLRGNEGGIDIGNRILAHLTDVPLAPVAYRRMTRFGTVDPSLRPGLKTWDKSFFALGEKAIPLDDRFLLLPADEEGLVATIVPAAPRFAGKVAVLIDSGNSSATHQFALRARHFGLATLIGEPTGGNRRGINGGAFFFATLPDSGLEFDLPLIGYFPERPQPDGGVDPDIAVVPTPAGIAAVRDEAMDRALHTVGA